VEANKPVVAVFEIKNEAKLNKSFVSKLHEVVAAELTASNKYSVVPNTFGAHDAGDKCGRHETDCPHRGD
jgi:hypothetical protein